MAVSTVAKKTPVHLWIVGGITLLWNAFGAFDYLMTQLEVEAYMAQMTPEQQAYFYDFPAWVDAAWAFGVWGAVAGSLGLLLRRRWAIWAFGVSLLGLVANAVYSMILTEGVALMGTVGMVMTAVIWSVAVALWFYARWMTMREILR